MIGYQYYRCPEGEWRSHHGALIPLPMPHAVSAVSIGANRIFALRNRVWFVRWEECFDQLETSEWWHVIKDDQEDLAALSGNTRSKVRRGAKQFETVVVDRGDIADEAYPVYLSAFDRYKTFEQKLSQGAFQEAVSKLPTETEFWAARDRETGQMVAFSENLVRDEACFYNTIWFDPKALRKYVGYILIHEMNKHYLNERKLLYVSDGARNISHKTGVHDFLEEKFGFRRAYARLRVVYFPGVGLAVRLLYPFRQWFAGHSLGIIQRAAVLLEQERIRRASEIAQDSAT